MAKQTTAENGHDRLEEAIAVLIQNQTSLLGRLSETERATSERFARIQTDIAAILRVLAEHTHLLERLPEAVREKIGPINPSWPGHAVSLSAL